MSTDAMDSGNLETGPLTLLEAVEAAMPEPSEAAPVDAAPVEDDNPQVETEQAIEADPVESTEEATAEPEAAESDAEAPQHLTLDDYGDLTIPVVIDGQESAVSLKEAAAGFQRNADYSRKMRALADDRAALDGAKVELQGQIQAQQQQIAELTAQTVGVEPDITLAEDDPFEYTRQKAAYDKRVADANDARAKAEAAHLANYRAKAAEEAKLLTSADPEFAKPEFLPAFIRDVSKAYGFNQQEVAQVIDHRNYLMARDAMRWRKSQQSAQKIVKQPGKVIKPGTVQTSSEQEASRKAAERKKLDKPGGLTVDEYLSVKLGG